MKNKSKLLLSSSILIILLSFLTSTTFQSTHIIAINSESSIEYNLAALTPSSPIIIQNNTAFETYGFPGNGSVADPYRIEGLNITTSDTYGISIQLVNVYFIIQDCYIDAGDFGIYLMSCSYFAEIKNNYIVNNLDSGIFLEDALGTNVTDNICKNNYYGIQTDYADFSVFKNNTCDNNNYGIYLYDTYESFILENKCSKNAYGIHSSSVTENVYQGNIIKDGVRGFYITDGSEHNIIDNYFENMSVYAMTCVSISNSNLSLNTVVDVFAMGFSFGSCINLLVTNNSVSDSKWGIVMTSSDNGIYIFNLFENNTNYGIQVEDANCDNNIFHHNAFIDNAAGESSQAYDIGTNSTWYDITTLEGNYYNDYIGTGNYSIDGGLFFDLYPLGSSPIVPEMNPKMISLLVLLMLFFIPRLALVNKRKK